MLENIHEQKTIQLPLPDAQKREIHQMQRMPEELQVHLRFKTTPNIAHGRTTLQMHPMPQELHVHPRVAQTREATQGRQTLHVQNMPKKLQHQRHPPSPHTYAHRRQEVPV